MDTAVRTDPNDAETTVVGLANGVRVVAIALPYLESVNVSVFVRTGSSHEPRRLNGISHFVEHMAFKGTHTRSCQQINLDAERLGADVNAHTDKDHTAYHMRGLGVDAARFVTMLGDIVRNSSFPEAELERERQVILHELVEDEEDVLSTADKLFDKLSFGSHPIAQPVIGSRLTIEHIGRADLLEYVGRQYSGANVVVGVAGRFDLAAVLAAAEGAFASMPAGDENRVEPPAYVGGIATRVQPGYSQTHVVLGYPIASLREDHHAGTVAAALFGEGMSSPLMDEIRERRGLVYYASCAAEVNELCGQFVVEASTSPAQLDEFLAEVRRLLEAQAASVAAGDLERARRQIAVRTLGAQERPARRLEDAALDLFVHGRVRSRAELLARIESVRAEDVRAVFARMLATPAALAIAGRVRKGASERGSCALRREGRRPGPPSVVTRFIDSGQPTKIPASWIVGPCEHEAPAIEATLLSGDSMTFTRLSAHRCNAARGIAAAAFLAGFAAGPALAAWEPSKPVEFVVPAGTGGGADQMARLIQGIIVKHKLTKESVIVVNKSGGAGAEGFLDVKGAKGDPHKIIITLSNLFTTPMATGVPFNWKEMTPVSMMALDQFVLWVNAEKPYRTASEYIAAVKAAGPSKIKMGGTGSKQEDQILTVGLEKATGTKFIYVPFKGGGEVAVQLVGNHIDSTVNNPIEAVAQWRAGQLRPLCVFDDTRMPYKGKVTDTQSWGDIPTCKESGVPTDYVMLRGIFMAPGVTPDQTAFYVDLMKKVRDTPDWKEFMEKGAFNTTSMSGAEFRGWLEKAEKTHEQLMTEAGFMAKK